MRTTRLALSLCSLLVAGVARPLVAQSYTLTISLNSPVGSVLGQAQYASGYSINCGHGESKCSASYPAGTTIFMQSVANIVGGKWTGWGGACSGTGWSCTVVMDGNKTIAPGFTNLGTYTLKVSPEANDARVESPAVAGSIQIFCGRQRLGNGSGSGGYCTATRTKGVEVVLQAMLSDDKILKAWTGACAGQGNPCRLSPHSDVTVSVQVGPKPPPAGRVTITAPSFGGSISVAGKTCPGDCSFTPAAGTKLVFTANPSAGFVVQYWEGACAGQANPCTITMDASDKAIAVRFWQR
jgi:hypothetical protein